MTGSAGPTRSRPPTVDAVRPPGVPWAHVLLIAVVLTLVNTAWMIVMRGAAGAAARTSSPATTWLRESAVLLPLYVAAVLGGITLARRLGGQGRRGARAALPGVLGVAGAGTVAGTLVLAASTWYDYVLEMQQVAQMSAMRGECADCVAYQEHATLIVQLEAVSYGGLFVLVTDVVVLVLVLGLLGGHLPLQRPRPGPATVGRRERGDELGVLLAASLVGSAVVHAAVLPEHVREWPAAGIFFALLALAELVAALVVLRRPEASVLLGVAGLSGATVLLWAASRSSGLPLGPEPGAAEAVGVADLAATSLEVLALLAALLLLPIRSWLYRPPSTPHVRATCVAAVVAVTALGVAGSTLPVAGVFAPVPTSPGAGSHGRS